jgi:hypothetical protein
LIKPASIGTPMPQHVKNYHDREANFPPPSTRRKRWPRRCFRRLNIHARAFIGGGARAI